MKKQLQILTLLTLGCSALEQNDYIERKELDRISGGTVFYKLYQTGIDNYRYEFYLLDKKDTIPIFAAYLNDATYKNLRFIVEESRDTVKIKSNRKLGQVTKIVGGRVFHLLQKNSTFERLGATVHAGRGQVPHLMLYNDSINQLSELEISIHKKIWGLEEVGRVARDLEDRNIKSFTFIEKYPSNFNEIYIVEFGQVLDEELSTIFVFRVNINTGFIDKIADTRRKD